MFEKLEIKKSKLQQLETKKMKLMKLETKELETMRLETVKRFKIMKRQNQMIK